MTRLLSRVSVALLLTLLVASAAIAQEKDDENHPITSKGSVAMLFQFGGLSSMQFAAVHLGSVAYPGEGESDAIIVYAAGMKYFLSDDLALRALLGFSTHTSGADSIGNGKTTETIFGIGVGVEMHTHAYHAVSPYFGAQVGFASASSDNTKNFVEGPVKQTGPLATTTTETKRSASGLNIGVLVGFDWYVMSSIAIGGEYTLGFSTASASQTVNGTKADAPSVTNFAIGTGDVHLLVHF